MSRRGVLSNQEKRYQKIFVDEFYLLDSKTESDLIECHVSGSTKNVYKVRIVKSTGKISCNCPDIINCNKHNVVCKHCWFIVYKVGRCFIGEPQNYEFWETNTLNDAQIVSIENRLVGNKVSEFMDDELVKKFKKLNVDKNESQEVQKTRFEISERELGEEDECPICYDYLKEQKNVSCPTCNQYVHEKCMLKWLETRTTCVLCRSDTWSTFKKETNSQVESRYIKL